MQHAVSMTFTGTEPEVMQKYMHEFVYRALCHAFIDRLPVNALEEIAECIADNYERHVVRPWWRGALPAASSSPKRLQGRLGPAKPRQSFHLEYE
jgi:hypothetical protein